MGGNALLTIKKRFEDSMLTKTTKAMIIQTVIESTMTFNCEIKAWQKKEIRKMQKVMNQGYRYLWINKKKGPALKQMEGRKVSMLEVRRNLGVMLLKGKIEERVL